ASVLCELLGLLSLDLASAEPPDIEKARMGTDPDTVFLGRFHRLEHDQRVAAVKSTGDVGRGDDLQHLGVAAHRPGAKALAHVAIEVDHIHRIPPPFPLIWCGSRPVRKALTQRTQRKRGEREADCGASYAFASSAWSFALECRSLISC